MLEAIKRPRCGMSINRATLEGKAWKWGDGKFTQNGWRQKIRNGQWCGGWVRDVGLPNSESCRIDN
jgi:hypothetical protein